MRIERIRIRGYRSLADLELRPSDFTVLVGPNNSGKSNIVDALAFVSDIYRDGAKLAIERGGGFENLSHRSGGEAGHRIDIEVEAVAAVWEVFGTHVDYEVDGEMKPAVAGKGDLLRTHHSFSLVGEGSPLISDFRIPYESIQITALIREDTPILHLTRDGSNTQFNVVQDESVRQLVFEFAPDGDYGAAAGLFGPAAPTRELLSARLQVFSPTLELFATHLSDLRVFRFVPDECRRPAAPTSAPHLGMRGENLPALVRGLQEEYPLAWSEVMQHMSQIVPDLRKIDVRTTEDRLWTLSFSEMNRANHWSAREVSDGTIRALALFTAVLGPQSSLLAIEEPENSVHPWIIREFVDICRAVTAAGNDKQVIVTTHSPVLIDHLEPSEVAIVWMDQGQTRVAPLIELDPDVRRIWENGQAGLFDLLDSGLLRQAVPSA